MIWPRSSRRASLPLNRPATFRLRDGCSASIWTAPDGSSLLTLDAPSVQTAPDGYRRIVWMIKRMIKAVRQTRMPRQADESQDSPMIKAHPTENRMPRRVTPVVGHPTRPQAAVSPCLQDSSGSSTECWRVLSLQLKSGGSSGQCAPVGPSSAWWNDQRNDRRLPCGTPSARMLQRCRRRPGRRGPWVSDRPRPRSA